MPAAEHFSIVDADGNVMPWQKSADGRLVFFAKGMPAKGYKTFSIVHGGEQGENTVKVENKTIENKFFTVKFDKDMNIASLIHKATGRSVAPEAKFSIKFMPMTTDRSTTRHGISRSILIRSTPR